MDIQLNGYSVLTMYDLAYAIATDEDGSRMDCIEACFYGEGSAMDDLNCADETDRLAMEHQGFRTGGMYADSRLPDGQSGTFRLLGRSIPRAGFITGYASYENITLHGLAMMAARDMGMAYAFYGMAQHTYKRLERREETWPAFLKRLCIYEGAILKITHNTINLIDIAWAQAQAPTMKMTLERYKETRQDTYSACHVYGYYANGNAADQQGMSGKTLNIGPLPVFDTDQANRWARGLIMYHNRMARQIKVTTSFNPNIAALTCVTLQNFAQGENLWIVGKVAHRLNLSGEGTSSIVLRPCINTIV